MSEIQKKRDMIKAVYPTNRWAKKVDSMRDDQVEAIFIRFKAQSKF